MISNAFPLLMSEYLLHNLLELIANIHTFDARKVLLFGSVPLPLFYFVFLVNSEFEQF